MRLPNGEVTAFTVVPVRRIGVIHLLTDPIYAKTTWKKVFCFALVII
jgi:hypothetical protein